MMTKEMLQMRIEKVRNALDNREVKSIQFNKDGSGAMFRYIDPTGDHGLPCEISSSFPMDAVIEIMKGHIFKQ